MNGTNCPVGVAVDSVALVQSALVAEQYVFSSMSHGVRTSAVQVVSGAVLAAYIGGGGLGDLLGGALGGLLGGAAAGTVLNGGLGGLLKQLQQSGQGDVARSWVGAGPNQTIPRHRCIWMRPCLRHLR